MGYEKTVGKDVKELTIANNKRKKIGLYSIIVPNPLAFKGVDPKDTKKYSAIFTTLYDY